MSRHDTTRAVHTYSRLGGRILLVLLLMLPALCSLSEAGGKKAKDDLEAAFNAARRGYWQEALWRYEAAAKEQPQSAIIHSNRAVALEAVGRFEEAREAYERARELAPGDRHIDTNYKRFLEFYEAYVVEPEDDTQAAAEQPAEQESAEEGRQP